jgi:hypothetical protein
MITLGGVVISDDMYLDGLDNASLASVEQLRTVDGNSIIRARPTPGGREITLGTQNRSGATQGIWCYSVIELVKQMELAALPVSLNYRGTLFEIIITGANFEPLLQFELEGPNKMFTGTISLIEV